MLLACDIGNTNIKTGIFNDGKLSEFNSFSDYTSLINYLKIISFDKAAISSVVPETKDKLSGDIFAVKKIKPFIITRSVKFNLKIVYDTIETLGIDRICSSEGAFSLFKKTNEVNNYGAGTYILSIDFGTATTINIIRYPGEFTGGIIAPGINMMFDMLNKKTSQLPNVNFSSYNGAIGKDTKSSIASGVLNSTVGLLEQVIKSLNSGNKNIKIKVYLTGGNAEKIMGYLPFEFVYEKGLVLEGIKTIYEKNFPS